MKRVEDKVRIEASVEQAWAVMCDTTRWKDFLPRAELSDFSGPVDEVGTTYVQSERFLGFEMRMTMTVVEVEPQLYHEHSDQGPVDTYFRFEPDGDATHLAVECDYDMPGRLPRFIKDLLRQCLVGTPGQRPHQLLAQCPRRSAHGIAVGHRRGAQCGQPDTPGTMPRG